MTQTSKDLIASAVVGVALIIVFISVELIETLFEATREYEDFELDDVLACIPAFAIVAAWFAMRRWREVGRLNGDLRAQARELERALEERRGMEEQLREGYKVAAMGTLGGGFAAELTCALEPISTLASEGIGQAGASDDEKARLERISIAARQLSDIVNRMEKFGDGGMRDTATIVASDAVRESVSLARNAVDTTVEIEYRMHDQGASIRVNRWELNEVGAQLVANAVDAMGAGGRVEVSVERTYVDADKARTQGLSAGAYVWIRIADSGPGIPRELQSHIFEPFFTTKGAGDAKGLGLTIAYSLVRGWNGNMTVEPEPGKGAAFEILVPIADADTN